MIIYGRAVRDILGIYYLPNSKGRKGYAREAYTNITTEYT
jgi:hypothetical protein